MPECNVWSNIFPEEARDGGEDKKAGCACAARNAGAGYILSPEMPNDFLFC